MYRGRQSTSPSVRQSGVTPLSTQIALPQMRVVAFLQKQLGSLQSVVTDEFREAFVTWAIRILLAVVGLLSVYAMLYGR
jgi:hypothetical protein